MVPAKLILPTAGTAPALLLPATEFSAQHSVITQSEILSIFFKVYLP